MEQNTTETGIKQVEIKPGSTFMANGTKYFVSETFTIGRMEKVEELEEELGQASDFRTCHAVMLAAMKDINDLNPGNAYMKLYSKIDSDQRNAKLQPFLIRMCTAYINYEGEDLRYLTDETIIKKQNDWAIEGLDVRPFYYFAVTVCKELLQNFKVPLANILSEAVTVKEALESVLDIRNLTGSNGTVTP